MQKVARFYVRSQLMSQTARVRINQEERRFGGHLSSQVERGHVGYGQLACLATWKALAILSN
jgi:hypothetical protein